MKTIYLILASIFLATSCKSDETNTEIIKGSPYPPYDYKQMAFYSSFRFVNSSGEASLYRQHHIRGEKSHKSRLFNWRRIF
ncbi:hypothetical protein AB4865_03050 [Capnocytophaga sp. ARDL2]|uniref:hypothetical protein n=1 Tax=Capnocytophaga sp. ARDL2 TaxID=3238809 RepID=UPI003555E79B